MIISPNDVTTVQAKTMMTTIVFAVILGVVVNPRSNAWTSSTSPDLVLRQLAPATALCACTIAKPPCSRDTFLEANNIIPMETTLTQDNSSPQWEKLAREWATDALVPVLAPLSQQAQLQDQPPRTALPVTAEKSLQRTLRSLPDHLTLSERRWMRGRLAKLVLGTSIMRLKYEYLWNISRSRSSNVSHREKIHKMVEFHDNDLLQTSSFFQDTSWPVDAAKRLSVFYSLPAFIVCAWIEQYGKEQAAQICHVSNEPGPITLRRNALKCPSDYALVRRLEEEEGINVAPPINLEKGDKVVWQPPQGCLRLPSSPRKRSIWSMPSWQDGWFEVQDVGSQVVVQATEACAGEIVVDYCAGNGGKSLALISQMHLASKNNANVRPSRIYSHDISDERIRQLRGSLPRAGLSSPSSGKGEDNQTSIQIITTTNAQMDIEGGIADVVLVDAPCSSSGVLRRRPSQRWNITQDTAQFELPKLQLEILRNASKLVKSSGGRLVYATCSLFKWENENIVKAIEREMGDSWTAWDFSAQQWPHQEGVEPHCRRLLPHVHNSDGFFIARWTRN